MKLKITLLCNALILSHFSMHGYDLKALAQQYVDKAELCKTDDHMDEAFEHYRNALELTPDDFMLTFNLANELYNHGHHEEAVLYYDKAATLRPDIEQIYFNRGIVLTQMKEHERAAQSFMQAINTKPTYIKAYVHAGHALEQCNKHDKALKIYQQGMAHNPDNADLHHRLGLVYKHLDQFDQAVDHLRIASQKNPASNTLKMELANTLHLVDGSMEALELYEKVLEHNPVNYHILYNFGYTLKKLGHIERALEVYDKVLEHNPEYPLARFSRALTYLTLGQWEPGWPEYEWRWDAYNESPKKFNCPVWNGEDIAGKHILIYAEQGLGDTIQFIRYAQLVKELGAHVIVQTQGALKDLLNLCPYIDEVYKRGEPLPPFDTHIAMMSLPMIFNTTVETTPHPIPYIYAQPDLVAYWADQLKDDTHFKIGICWQGNPNYRTQFLRQAVAGKSMHVKEFAPLARLEGVSLYNLQKMGGEEQLKECGDDVVIRSFGPDLDTDHGRFMDTVAIMKNLDLIITIDTGTCHVAAALGVPTWNLLPNPADWRWMLDRDDTPWYDNMRLFKQPKPGDWSGAIEACKQALMPILYGQKTVQEVTACKGSCRDRRPYECLQSFRGHNEQETKKRGTNIRTFASVDFDFEPIANEQTMQADEHQHKPTEFEKALAKLSQEHPEIKHMVRKPQQKKSLHDLTTQLIAINKELWKLDQEIQGMKPSAFDDAFMHLAEQIVTKLKQKTYIKKHIKQQARKQYSNA